jgi:hypothetical protein
MASASSKRTLDTDYITLRTVFAKLSDNRQVLSTYVLASVGDGRTYWADPSTLGGLPTFSEFVFDTTSYSGTGTGTGTNELRLSASNGLGFSTTTSSTVSSLQLLGKNFSYIDISGAPSLYAFSNYVLNNSLFLATEGFLSSFTTPSETTVTIRSLVEAPPLSTNIISYQSLKIISTLVSPIDTSQDSGNMIWSKTDATTAPVFAGTNDFIFQTRFVPPILGLELSSYSAKTFLGVSTGIATLFLSTISSISSVYTQKDIFSTALISLSTTNYTNVSTNLSTTFGVSNYTQVTYNQKFGDTMARATIIQLNDQFGILNTGVSTISSFKTPLYIMLSTNQGFINSYSTPQSLSSSTFLDFTAGSLFDFTVNGMLVVSTQLSTLSTSIGSNIVSFSNGIQQRIPPFFASTTSTFANLGSIGYISSQSLQSTVKTLGSEGYVSTPSLVSSFSTFLSGYPSTVAPYFTSTTKGLTDRQLIISTLTLQSSIVSTTRGLQLEAAYTYVSTSQLTTTIQSTTNGLVGYLGFSGYVSSLSFTRTLESTIKGLSTSLFVTTSQSVSSIQSTNDAVSFVTIATAQAEFATNSNYLTINQLVSTTRYFETITRQFFSSLTIPSEYSQQQTTMIPIFAGQSYGPNNTSNFYFSSIQYPSLGGYNQVLQNAQYVTIEYTPTIFFSPYNEPPYIDNFFPSLSTGIQIGSNFLPATLFKQQFVAPFSISNVYSKKLCIQLDRNNLLSAQSNGFSIVHIFENIKDEYSDYFRFTTDVGLYTSRSNSLFISIYN